MLCREKTSTALFFKYNSQLGPPYQVLVDTNFINFSIKNKVRPYVHCTPGVGSSHESPQQPTEICMCLCGASTFGCAMQIDLVQGMMDCLYAECTPCITDCVLAELEKLGQKYRVALKVAKVRRLLDNHRALSLHQEGLVICPRLQFLL